MAGLLTCLLLHCFSKVPNLGKPHGDVLEVDSSTVFGISLPKFGQSIEKKADFGTKK